MRCLPMAILLACTPTAPSPSSDKADTEDPTDSKPDDSDQAAEDTDPEDTDPLPHKGPWFPPGNPWERDITNDPVDPDSDAIIAWLDAVGWGLGRMQIDLGFEVLTAGPSDPIEPFTPTDDHYSPDCDTDPVPLPPGGNLEWESGYECTTNGDCHLIVHAPHEDRLYEMWRANVVGDDFQGGCLAVWDLTRDYPDTLRGEQCTSADAAGFPIAPLLFTADEVAAGSIDHAIRFILPNSSMRAGVYVRPATHAGGPSGPDEAPPYGVRLRLRADYPLGDLPNDGARTVARAMQTHGMLLADGGNVALTARSDARTTAKWADHLGTRDLDLLQPADFEVMEMGTQIPLTYDCVRTP